MQPFLQWNVRRDLPGLHMRRIAEALKACLKRPGDLVARYGGEEFCAVLPHCGLADAEKIAQSIVQQIREQNVMLGEQQIAKFSLSIGVAAHQHAEDLLATIKHADEALYAAKNAGRDRVCAADACHGI